MAFSALDATEGLSITEGCQIGVWVCVFTNGSKTPIRLLVKQYVNVLNNERKGYTHGSVNIGAYAFIRAGAMVLLGVSMGKCV